MVSLVGWIVRGMGWELGRTAAQEAISTLREQRAEAERAEDPAEVRRRAKAAAADAKRREREAAAETKRRAKEAKARERAVDRELAELKKRVSKG